MRDEDRQLTLLAQVAQEGLLELLQLAERDRAQVQREKLHDVEQLLERLESTLAAATGVTANVVPDPLARRALESVLARRKLAPDRRGVTTAELSSAKKVVSRLASGERADDESVLDLLAFLRKAIERRVVVGAPVQAPTDNAGV